jgi:threonine dehydrogenase-like Zn-dependent dehydrogenase
MRALTLTPGQKDSARLEEIPEPALAAGVLVETLCVGICGTDREILNGEYGEPPPGEHRLVLGHESLGRVKEAPADSGLRPGDLVAGIVRRPDPVPCESCAVGEWDMCRNGRYTEHGIKGLHGFAAERFRAPSSFLVKLDPALESVGVLLEPASVVAKAWDHIDRIGAARGVWNPKTVLVIGAGPIGLLAALLGAQRGLEVHCLDRATDGPKPALVGELGGHYHTGSVQSACRSPDVVLECTGVGELIFDAMEVVSPNGIVCLTGVSPAGRTASLDMQALNKQLVLENNVVFGSVNANRRHYDAAAAALLRAPRRWLEAMITRRIPLDRWEDAIRKQPHDVKAVLEFG